jgi:hypothetical protein
MRAVKPWTWIVSAAVVLLATGGLALSATGDTTRVSSGGDPHHVTLRELRDRLERSGVAIRPARHPAPSRSTIAGVASAGRAMIGFEFQVFSSSDVATIRGLGRLRPPDFGWPPTRFDPLYRTWIRGVLSNVAYAQYEIETDRQLGAEPARRRIIRALDDALIGAFPADDPYVHAMAPAEEP